jgi:DNA-binding transcriptional ArsR family regulator
MSPNTDEPGQPPSGPGLELRPGMRRVTDARTMRALAHPVRIALLEELVLGGALTATQIGERIGESPTTCSFHLRQLARYGFVEEAGGGKGRARPWRLTSIGLSFPSTNDDPEAEIAAGTLSRLVRERQLGRYWTWVETRSSYARAWRDAADESEYLFYLTPAELKQLNQDLYTMLSERYEGRLADPSLRPPGSAPVEMLTFNYPIRHPAAGDGAAGAGEPGGGAQGGGESGDGGAGGGAAGDSEPGGGAPGDDVSGSGELNSGQLSSGEPGNGGER